MQTFRLLYITHEPWPTYHADIAALFGKYLPRLGLKSDLVTEKNISVTEVPWNGGATQLCTLPNNRALQHIMKLWHNISILLYSNKRNYSAIQVRDLPVAALFGLTIASCKRLPFFYWMSFPQSEGQILRAKNRGFKAGFRYWFPLLQGHVGKFLLYRIILPRTTHIFVQSEQMRKSVAAFGIALENITAVPMGVDLEAANLQDVQPIQDERLNDKQVIVYIGTLDPERQIELLLEMLALARRTDNKIILVLAGSSPDTYYLTRLQQQANRLGIADAIIWTGWLPMQEAWRYVRAAKIGVSPYPRSSLFDGGSPTKAYEYMALGIPVIGSDNPDQAMSIIDSGAGLCVHLTPECFASALLELLQDEPLRLQMAQNGRQYIADVRNYDQLARKVFEVYRHLLTKKHT